MKGPSLDLSTPLVMGVLNVTPDSFSDGGRYLEPAQALEQARQMVEEGAAVVDVGGESTRPGAQSVPLAEELRRVLPVIEMLAATLPQTIISIDSTKPDVMRAACAAGARLINDVNALRAPGALTIAAEASAMVCLMHMQGEPRTMQQSPQYADVVSEVKDFLTARAKACEQAGIPREKILLDPGFGFGKTLTHNLQLLARLDELAVLGYPLLVGMSRKSMLGTLLDRPVGERVHGHDAAVALAVWQGAKVIRTHDVKATVDSVKIAIAVKAMR